MLAFTPDQLVATMTGLVPDLCEHLENTSAFFQVQPSQTYPPYTHINVPLLTHTQFNFGNLVVSKCIVILGILLTNVWPYKSI